MLLIACGAAMSGCASSTDKIAREARFQKSIVPGTSYRHVLYSRQGTGTSQRLHVYIEGDGTPWNHGIEPSPDPTPSNPLALRLMAKDPATVMYLGRPCYFGLVTDTGCASELWTSARYSGQVAQSMAQAIRRRMSESGHSEAVLIGYSGGGTVARLVAALVPGVSGVLTVNANLDIDAWTDLRGYQPLHDSINPARANALPAGILHVQAIGDKDIIVDPEVTERYRLSGQPVEIWHYAEFDHVCCWLDAWPDILKAFQAILTNRADRGGPTPVYDRR